MSMLPIARLLSTGRHPEHPVAIGGAVRRYGTLAAAVGGVVRRLADTPPGPAVLLAEDGGLFVAGFLGALHAGREVVLPPRHGLLAAAGGGAVLDTAWLAATAPLACRLAPLDAAVCSVTFFTSGSTGTPKRVRRTLAGLQAELDSFEAAWGSSSGCGPVVATVSHQHLYGLTFRLLWPLAAGRPFVAETAETWEAVLPLLEAEAMLISSPAHLTRMAGLPPLPPERRPARVFSAGAPLPYCANPAAAAVLGVLPTEVFGSTESGAIATRTQSDRDTPWRPLPGVAVRRAADGRLAVSTPAAAAPGWHDTEDLIEAAGPGFHFLGRADRMAKIEGKRVDLLALEHALAASPWAEAAAVLVLADPVPCLGAVVVLTGAGRDGLADMGEYRFGRMLRGMLAMAHEPAGLPRRWRFVATLPAGLMGKPSEAALRALFAGP